MNKWKNVLMEPSQINPNFKCGYIVIIGEPNVGKSTLMNTFIGQKISIVTDKPQTTRHKILGILSDEQFQIIFLDTPGLLKPKYLLHNVMMDAVHTATNEADVVFFMVDALDPKMEADIDHEVVFKVLKKINKPVFLVINKVDIIDKFKLLPIIDFYTKRYEFVEVFPISALNAISTADLLKSVVGKLPIHPPYYPLDVVSDSSERFFVSELIREKIFEKFRQEVPYSTTVEIIEFREQEGKKDFISAEIFVERQKGFGFKRNRRVSAY